MIKIWINKQREERKDNEFEDALVFNAFEANNNSNIKTDLQKIWWDFNTDSLSETNEDFLFIAMVVMAIDKQIPRDYFIDRWTREIKVSIPVISYERWTSVTENLNKMLSFLSGDIWDIQFRNSNLIYRKKPQNYNSINIQGRIYDGVSLFSAGLDSFAGAVKLLSQGKNILFTGFKEYTKLGSLQTELYNELKNYYTNNSVDLKLYWLNSCRAIGEDIELASKSRENTSRTRSLLFLAMAISQASLIQNDIPVYIPENGFIGINVPLTESRSGSCSTRTTHPYFINLLNEILSSVGIRNRVINIYSNKSKGQIVEELKNNLIFKKNAKKTISCSHPCQARYDGHPTPQNCGCCYPCLIRKAAMCFNNIEDGNYTNSLNLALIQKKDRGSDLRAVLSTLKRYSMYKDDEKYMFSLLLKSGRLTHDEFMSYKNLYVRTMDELLNMIIRNQNDELNNFLNLQP